MTERKTPTKKKRLTDTVNTLRFQVMLIMLLCYFVPTILLGTFTQAILLREIREKTRMALQSEANHAWTLTIQNIDHAIAVARDAIYDGELSDTYSKWNNGSISNTEYLRLSRNYLERKYSRDEVFTFAAYFPVNQPELLLYTRSGNTEAVMFQQNMLSRVEEEGKQLDTSSRFMESDGRLYLVRNLMNLKMERYGMLILGIDRDVLLGPLDEIAAGWPAQLQASLDGCGETERLWQDAKTGLHDIPGSREIAYVRASENDDYDLKIRLTVDSMQQYRESYMYRMLLLGIYVLMIPILLLIARYVQKRIVKPISLLSEASRRIEAGELGVTVPMRGGDELGNLGVAFSNMSRRIQELIDKTYKEEIDLKDAQIQALQSRINPHFINNALEVINWQARIDGSETISSMVTSLSVLLNATLGRKERRMVALKEEMEVAEAYIYFVQQRYGSDLVIERDLQEEAMDSVVPLLTVQPVLENAVEHGISPNGGGLVRLEAQKVADCLQITIINTGKPLQPDDREKIDVALQGDASVGNHLGLVNIVNRLKLIYNGRAEIRIYSDENQRTVVQMSIPQDGE